MKKLYCGNRPARRTHTNQSLELPAQRDLAGSFRHFRDPLREANQGEAGFSDNFGHGNCVILRESAKWRFSLIAANALNGAALR
jgi:hypothetical protein